MKSDANDFTNVLKGSSCRALMMSRYLPAASNLNTKQCKVHFHRNRKDSQISQSGQPVKSVNAHLQTYGNNKPMGKTLTKCVSPEESTGNSHSRTSRTSEKNNPLAKRSSSMQPKLGQHNPTNSPEISSGCCASLPDYKNHGRDPYKTYDSMGNSWTLGTGSTWNQQFDRTATDYSNYGAGVGTDAIPSRGDSSYKGRTKQPEHQLSRGSAGLSDIALVHTWAIAPSASSDANGRSTGRQSRPTDKTGAPRLRSASQGLRNLGNTCYMNSILQCLAKVPWFTDKPSLKFGDDLLNEFFSLMKKMQENESESSLDPYRFRKQIGALGIRFSSSEQNDAHEFLLCLLSRLSKALKREGKSDVVADFLLGQQQNVIRFKKCNHTLINDQPFFSLLLPLTQESGQSVSRHTTVYLEQCLKNYTKKEDVDGDALCMDCQLMQLCSIEASFKRLPKFLVIYLKRYDFMKAEKLENEVRFREALRMTQKAIGEVSGSEDYVDYDLIAVCNHYGSLRFGHYTADIKSPSNNWYNYSDSRVTKTEISLSSRDAYILFYQQRPN